MGAKIHYKEEGSEVVMAEMKEISNFDELRKLRLADEGYIVIADAHHAIIHRVNAKCISNDNFHVKVSFGENKKGGYFWVDSIATAAHEFGAKRCKVCRPETFLVDSSTFGRN